MMSWSASAASSSAGGAARSAGPMKACATTAHARSVLSASTTVSWLPITGAPSSGGAIAGSASWSAKSTALNTSSASEASWVASIACIYSTGLVAILRIVAAIVVAICGPFCAGLALQIRLPAGATRLLEALYGR